MAINASTPVVASARDPCVYEYQGALRQSTDESASIYGIQGARKISPEEYMEVIAALKPDVAVAMSDEVVADVKVTRAATSVDRTIAWLDRCLASPSADRQPILACIQGAGYLAQRKRCLQAVASRMSMLGGVCISGLDTGESREQRTDILIEVLQQIPREKIRMVSSLFTPLDMLEAIQLGADLFDMSYIASVTAGGYALTFPVTPDQESEWYSFDAMSIEIAEYENDKANTDTNSKNDIRATTGQDDMKINLWASIYRLDQRSLTPWCSCAASTHSRAYIHHLLKSHEMTAYVLLESHNTEHMLRFFSAIRAAISAGSIREYEEWFRERKRRWLFGEK